MRTIFRLFNNKYVLSSTLNGKELSNFWVTVRELLKGGILILEMGPNLNVNWGLGSMTLSNLDVKNTFNENK
ncbi:hypothetical protein H4O18_21245 [Arenibacter sp. BSSL-BM3]|uniref:Uncharacterized protein n=1 Tax=Arenibacter arenosicollis TaxID=2762274 RepID=A0ABR7QTL0_9FLAO|nr:hypothetical protein [Arenibacter arenosicollis]MBC8770533.1 hypothetical protein [Arenibacter arenosicollis]